MNKVEKGEIGEPNQNNDLRLADELSKTAIALVYGQVRITRGHLGPDGAGAYFELLDTETGEVLTFRIEPKPQAEARKWDIKLLAETPGVKS